MPNLSPTSNDDVQMISRDIWENFWKKYRDTDQFTKELWRQIVKDMNEFGKRWNDCQFAIHIAMCYLNELEARDRGSYHDKYNRDF